MKKSYFLSLLLSTISFLGISQVIVTDAHLLDIGDYIYLSQDESSIVNIGNPGQNQIWDFSTLQSMDSWSMEVVDPIITPFDQLYPNANLCIIDDGDFIYCDKSSSGIAMLGIGDSVAQQSVMLIPLPLSYSFAYTDGPVLALDSLIGGPMVDFLLTSQGFSASLLTFGATHVADSLNIQLEMTTNFEVDGEGLLMLPMGNFDALRVKVDRTTNPSISVYCIDTNGGANSGWYPLNFGGGSETESFYHWYSNDVTASFTLAEVYLDSLGNPETGVSFLNTSINSVDKIDFDYINVYPIPSTYNINITSENNEEVNTKLIDINGQEIKRFKFVNSTVINLSDLDKGSYLLILNTKKGRITKKIILE